MRTFLLTHQYILMLLTCCTEYCCTIDTTALLSVSSLLDCVIKFNSNPRNEAAENELDVRNDKFGNLGVDFRSLDDNLFDEVSITYYNYCISRHNSVTSICAGLVCHLIHFYCLECLCLYSIPLAVTHINARTLEHVSIEQARHGIYLLLISSRCTPSIY
jgi:hypothetical protein